MTENAPVNDLKPQGAYRFLMGSWGLQPVLQELTADTFLKPMHRNKNVPGTVIHPLSDKGTKSNSRKL